MNVILPLILLIIANLVLYWIFFGKARFDKKIHLQIQTAKANGREISAAEQKEIKQMTTGKIDGIFGNEDPKFTKDKLVLVKSTSNLDKKDNKNNKLKKNKKKDGSKNINLKDKKLRKIREV